jgi:FHS family glucose/mannose:H+ symporter-like MFS transporter
LLFPLLCISRCKEPAAIDSSAERSGNMNNRTKLKLVSPLLFFLLAAMLTYVAVETGIAFFANVLFVTEYSNTELGAYAISGFWLAMTVFRFAFALIKMKMRNMILLGFSASCVLLILLLFFRNQWVLLGLFILLGTVLAPVWPMIIGIGTSSFRERSGTVASILTASGGLGGAVIPVLIGWVSEWGGFYGGFWLLAVASAIGFFVILKTCAPVVE